MAHKILILISSLKLWWWAEKSIDFIRKFNIINIILRIKDLIN